MANNKQENGIEGPEESAPQTEGTLKEDETANENEDNADQRDSEDSLDGKQAIQHGREPPLRLDAAGVDEGGEVAVAQPPVDQHPQPVLGQPHLDDFSMIEDDYAIGDAAGKIHFMCDNDHCHAFLGQLIHNV